MGKTASPPPSPPPPTAPAHCPEIQGRFMVNNLCRQLDSSHPAVRDAHPLGCNQYFEMLPAVAGAFRLCYWSYAMDLCYAGATDYCIPEPARPPPQEPPWSPPTSPAPPAPPAPPPAQPAPAFPAPLHPPPPLVPGGCHIASTVTSLRASLLRLAPLGNACLFLSDGAYFFLAGTPIQVTEGNVTLVSERGGAVLDAQALSRVIDVRSWSHLTLQSVHLINGVSSSTGGAFSLIGALSLTGGALSTGSASMSHLNISNCSAQKGGALYVRSQNSNLGYQNQVSQLAMPFEWHVTTTVRYCLPTCLLASYCLRCDSFITHTLLRTPDNSI